MTVKERILTIRLSNRIAHRPKYANCLSVNNHFKDGLTGKEKSVPKKKSVH